MNHQKRIEQLERTVSHRQARLLEIEQMSDEELCAFIKAHLQAHPLPTKEEIAIAKSYTPTQGELEAIEREQFEQLSDKGLAWFIINKLVVDESTPSERIES